MSVPGRGSAPAELLAVGPPAQDAPPAALAPQDRWLRGLAAAAALVLTAGVLTAVRSPDPSSPRPARPVAVPLGVPGVTATVALLADEPAVTRLRVDVALEGGSTGRGDTGGSPEPERLALLAVDARGFGFRPVTGPLPLPLAEVGRFGSGLPSVVPVPLDAVVGDCSVDTRAPRRIVLQVRRGGGPAGRVLVASQPDVVRALDGLVARTCRRTRG